MKNLNGKTKDELINIIEGLIIERDEAVDMYSRLTRQELRLQTKLNLLQSMITGGMEAM